MKSKIVIFGGSGFIGSHFNSHLKSDAQGTVLSFDINPDNKSQFMDVRSKINIQDDFNDNDTIINLAAVHRTPGSPDYDYFETNILGAENVCEFAGRVGIKKIIFTSSIAPYGASEEEKKETTLPTPNTPYGISKLVAEHIHKEWAVRNPERRLLILRPGVVFGKGENGNNTRLASAIKQGIFFYPGRKDTIKANIYVKDLVKLSWELINKQSQNVDLYNFAYTPGYTIEEIVSTMAAVMGIKKPSVVINGKLLMAVAKIFQMLGVAKGFHPARINKLMNSTNICGEKLRNAVGGYHYTLQEAIEDWYEDCDKRGLF